MGKKRRGGTRTGGGRDEGKRGEEAMKRKEAENNKDRNLAH